MKHEHNMENIIASLPQQLQTEVSFERKEALASEPCVIVGGMGGSHLAAGVLRDAYPALPIFIHHGYDLPQLPHVIQKNSLYIASSYSGNTEETLHFFSVAQTHAYSTAIITSGGTLLNQARERNLPVALLPQDGIPPRYAIGYSLRALAELISAKHVIADITQAADDMQPDAYAAVGRDVGEKIKHTIPVIYASDRNKSLAYIWKVQCNETAKINAFAETIPEANHNSLAGVAYDTREVAAGHSFIFLHDPHDDLQVQKRMQLTQELYDNKGYSTISVQLPKEGNRLSQMFASILAAWQTSFHIAQKRGVNPEETEVIEQFKSKL